MTIEFDPNANMGAPLQQTSQALPQSPLGGMEQYFASREGPNLEGRNKASLDNAMAIIAALMKEVNAAQPNASADTPQQVPQGPTVNWSIPRNTNINQTSQHPAQQQQASAPSGSAGDTSMPAYTPYASPISSGDQAAMNNAIMNYMKGGSGQSSNPYATPTNVQTQDVLQTDPNSLPSLY